MSPAAKLSFQVVFRVLLFFLFSSLCLCNRDTSILRVCNITQTYTYATVNVCTSFSTTKCKAIQKFIQDFGIDILHLQDIRNVDLEISNYDYYKNTIKDTGQGVGVLARKDLAVTDLRYHPSGRILSFYCNDVVFSNVYAFSGSQHRLTRERFFHKSWLPL